MLPKNLDKHNFSFIVKSLALGELVKEPQKLESGLFNQTWLVTTTDSYVIKLIGSDQPRLDSDYEWAEKLALLFKNHGIPAVPALELKGAQLQHVGSYKLLVYPYVSGKVASLKTVAPKEAHCIGNYLGCMHQCGKTLVFNTKDAVPSHRDLNPKNVLWDDSNQPRFIDWEWAGFIRPSFEAIHTALMWAGLMEAAFNEQIYVAFLEGYLESGEKITETPTSLFNAVYHLWQDWLKIIKKSSLSALEREREIQKTVAILNFITTSRSYWESIQLARG